MKDFINYMEIFEKFEMNGKLLLKTYEAIECNDGFTMSVQASSNHYCVPREMTDIENYTHFEVSAEDEPLFKPYVSSDNDHIFARVPKEIIEKVIEKHGLLKKMKEEIETEKKALSKVIKKSGKLKKKKDVEPKRI